MHSKDIGVPTFLSKIIFQLVGLQVSFLFFIQHLEKQQQQKKYSFTNDFFKKILCSCKFLANENCIRRLHLKSLQKNVFSDGREPNVHTQKDTHTQVSH